MKDYWITPGGPNALNACNKKQIVRESAEVVVCEMPITKGPNVYIVQIIIRKV